MKRLWASILVMKWYLLINSQLIVFLIWVHWILFSFLWWVHCNYPLNLLVAVQIRDSWGFWRGSPVHTEGPAPRSHPGPGFSIVHTVCFNTTSPPPNPNTPAPTITVLKLLYNVRQSDIPPMIFRWNEDSHKFMKFITLFVHASFIKFCHMH